MINESKPFLHLWMGGYCSEKVSQVGGVSFLTWKIKVIHHLLRLYRKFNFLEERYRKQFFP